MLNPSFVHRSFGTAFTTIKVFMLGGSRLYRLRSPARCQGCPFGRKVKMSPRCLCVARIGKIFFALFSFKY